jgi:hypothetical protein
MILDLSRIKNKARDDLTGKQQRFVERGIIVKA